MFTLFRDLLPGCANFLLQLLLLPKFFPGALSFFLFLLYFDLKLVSKVQLIELETQLIA